MNLAKPPIMKAEPSPWQTPSTDEDCQMWLQVQKKAIRPAFSCQTYQLLHRITYRAP